MSHIARDPIEEIIPDEKIDQVNRALAYPELSLTDIADIIGLSRSEVTDIANQHTIIK